MYDIPSGASFADWVDALKEQDSAPAPDALAKLEPTDVQRLEECAQRYEQQSALPEGRRSRVALMLVDASEATVKAAINYLARRLSLRFSSIDARSVDGLLDDEASAKLHPLVDQFARLVLLDNVSNAIDPRVRDALAWSSRNVLVIGTCASSESLGNSLKRHFQFFVEHKRRSLLQRLGFAS